MLAALLLLAPLVRGGNRELAMSALLALGLALLATVMGRLAQARQPGVPAAAPVPRWWWPAVVVVASSPAWLGALQLLPIMDAARWAGLAGRQGYLDALQAAGVAVPERLPLSLNPWATWAAMWSGVPVVAAFVAALRLSREQVDGLLTVLLLAGALQVLMAVAQFASGPKSMLYFGLLGHGFIGTFANRNHLADFLAMLLPLCFYAWLVLRRGAQGGEGHGGQGSTVGRLALVLLGFGLVLVILSSQSRGGILASVAVLLLSALLLAFGLRHALRRWQRWALVAACVLLSVLALGAIDLQGIAARMAHERLQTDAQVRHAMALATWDAARALWPWGSGMGTFESVFPRYQPAATPVYVNHAHNDYAQMLMELGAPALLLVALLGLLVVRQLVALVRALRASGRLSSELGMRCFAGLGALALLLHSWVEFNMHIPALALTASFLMGVFLRPLSARH